MITIGEAYSDENGKGRGGQPGDQTGKELRIRKWYNRSGGWGVYLKCKDQALAARAAQICREIIESRLFGYDKGDRWTGYKALTANGGKVQGAQKAEFDCSSLCITAYILAGLDIPATGYTGNMERIFKATGKFVALNDANHLTGRIADVGGMYLASGHHVMMVLDAPTTASEPSGTRAVRSKGSVRIRARPVDGKTVAIIRKGQTAELLDVDTSGWYKVRFGEIEGFMTSNPRYVEDIYE